MDSVQASELFQAYRQGLLRRPLNTWEGRPRSFDFLFRQAFSNRLPVRERVWVCRIWRASFEGLGLSRSHRLDEAAAAFARSWSEVESARVSTTGVLLATTFLESAHAYLDYKMGAFDLARERISRSMEADVQLQGDFDLLELHRIQLAHNLMRIDLRAGEPRRALRLGGEILAYLEGLSERLTLHHSWQGESFLERTPRAVRRALIAQVMNEVALAFCTVPAPPEEDFLAAVGTEAYRRPPRVVHDGVRLWLLARLAFREEGPNRYLQTLPPFLAGGRVGIQAIWYSALSDLLAHCGKVETPASLGLRSAILKEAPKWTGLPKPLRPLLGLAPQEEPAHPPPAPALAAGLRAFQPS